MRTKTPFNEKQDETHYYIYTSRRTNFKLAKDKKHDRILRQSGRESKMQEHIHVHYITSSHLTRRRDIT